MTTYVDLYNADTVSISTIIQNYSSAKPFAYDNATGIEASDWSSGHANVANGTGVYKLTSSNYGVFYEVIYGIKLTNALDAPAYVAHLKLRAELANLRNELKLSGVLSEERTNIIKDATEVSKIQTALGV